MGPGAYGLNTVLLAACGLLAQMVALQSFLLYPLRVLDSGCFLVFVRNRGTHKNGASSLEYPHSH